MCLLLTKAKVVEIRYGFVESLCLVGSTSKFQMGLLSHVKFKKPEL